MNLKELKYLMELLDDPDENIYSHVRNKFVDYGVEVIPYLQELWESSLDMLLQNRIEGIIHEIQLEDLAKSLSVWKRYESDDLLKGVILVNRYQYPDLEELKLRRKIDELKKEVWLETNYHLTALENVKIINRILFEEYGFSGNTINFHAPQNSYLSAFLETRRGNPLILSILYMLVAQGAEIPIYGINLPEHFVLGYLDIDRYEYPLNREVKQEHILFYINTFNKGNIFSRKDIRNFLNQVKIEVHENFYLPCDHITIIFRLLNNLILSYKKLGYTDKVHELRYLQKVLLSS
jgi:regulator of sirC expression with transglutaminase-like and TPR domain